MVRTYVDSARVLFSFSAASLKANFPKFSPFLDVDFRVRSGVEEDKGGESRLGHLPPRLDRGIQARYPTRAVSRLAEMVCDYIRDHPTESPEDALTDCLIATQCSPSPGDSERMAYFWNAWGQILGRSKKEIEAFIKADLDLAMDDGNYDLIARLYAADYHRWEKGREASG